MMPTHELLDRYADATGITVDPAALRFWTVLGQFKAAAIFLRGCLAFEQGRTGDIRLAALGYRSLYVLREIAIEIGILGRRR